MLFSFVGKPLKKKDLFSLLKGTKKQTVEKAKQQRGITWKPKFIPDGQMFQIPCTFEDISKALNNGMSEMYSSCRPPEIQVWKKSYVIVILLKYLLACTDVFDMARRLYRENQ